MKKVDDFVGTTFLTPKGHTLVIGTDNGLKGDKKRYFVTCSMCSLDYMMNPKDFMASKNNLLKGFTPCQCSLYPKLNKTQAIIDMQRTSDKVFPEKFKVVGIFGKSGTAHVFSFECKVCSKDKELYPSFFFLQVQKGVLLKGVYPAVVQKITS